MSRQAINEAEIADVIRRSVELQHAVRVLRVRLENEADGPLAAVAAQICAGCERSFERAAEQIREAAPALKAVMID